MKRRKIAKRYYKKIGDKLSTSTDIELMFLKWMSKNIHRFNYKPKASLFNMRVIYIENIIKDIMFILAYELPFVELCLFMDDGVYPYISDIEMVSGIDKLNFDEDRGWFDDVNSDDLEVMEPDEIRYFKTIEEVANHRIFEPFLEYCNKNLMPEKSLYAIEFDCIGYKKVLGFSWLFAGISWSDETIDKRNPILTINGMLEKYYPLDASQIDKTTKYHTIIKRDLIDNGSKPQIRYLGLDKKPTKEKHEKS